MDQAACPSLEEKQKERKIRGEMVSTCGKGLNPLLLGCGDTGGPK